MTNSKTTAAVLALLVAAVAVMKLRGVTDNDVAPASNDAAGVNPFLAPYGWATPGISDDPITLSGGAPFQSVVNVTVNPSYLGTLSQQFIPLFGFVGLAVDPASQAGGTTTANQAAQPGGQPTRVVAPPPAAYVAPPASSIAPDPFNQASPVRASNDAVSTYRTGNGGGTRVGSSYRMNVI